MPGIAAVGMKTAARIERDGDDGAADLLHGFFGGGLGIQTLVDMVLDGLDDDDGVVNYQADGEHKAEERKRVDGEAERRENDEGSNERDRNSQQRNERGAPALQEDEDDKDNEAERFEEREEDLANARGNSLGGVERNAVSDAWRKGGGKLLHALGDGRWRSRQRWTRGVDRSP